MPGRPQENSSMSTIKTAFNAMSVVLALSAMASGGFAIGAADDRAGPSVAPSQAEQLRELVLTLHNQARLDEKLPSLAVNKKLEAAAEAHAKEMARRHTMTHTGEDGSTPTSRIEAQGYRLKRCGENVAFGRYSPQRLMKGWIDSPVHRANIFGNFTQIGVGYAVAQDGTAFWCVNFGLPARRK
jgi:uncharacterized protein YkwD